MYVESLHTKEVFKKTAVISMMRNAVPILDAQMCTFPSIYRLKERFKIMSEKKKCQVQDVI